MATNEDNIKWSLGEARLSETPYKHVVRHAVTDNAPPTHSHLVERAVCADTEDVTPSGSLGEARLSETPYKHVVRHAVTG